MPEIKLTWIPADPVFAKGIDRYIRDADRQELFLTSGRDPEPLLKECIEMSDQSWVVMINGNFGALLGIGKGTLLGSGGQPWLVASNEVEKIPCLFVEKSRLVVEEMGQEYGRLYNLVWDGHTAAKRWLRAVGFTLGEPQPYGLFQAPFRPFWRNPLV